MGVSGELIILIVFLVHQRQIQSSILYIPKNSSIENQPFLKTQLYIRKAHSKPYTIREEGEKSNCSNTSQPSPFKTMSAINDPIAAASSGPSEPVQEVHVDVTKLTALSPEVISKQATVCRFPTRGSVSYRDIFRKLWKKRK